jgi:hypothetical protein
MEQQQRQEHRLGQAAAQSSEGPRSQSKLRVWTKRAKEGWLLKLRINGQDAEEKKRSYLEE